MQSEFLRIAQELLGNDLPYELSQELVALDALLRKVGSSLQSRQMIGLVVSKYMLLDSSDRGNPEYKYAV